MYSPQHLVTMTGVVLLEGSLTGIHIVCTCYGMCIYCCEHYWRRLLHNLNYHHSSTETPFPEQSVVLYGELRGQGRAGVVLTVMLQLFRLTQLQSG